LGALAQQQRRVKSVLGKLAAPTYVDTCRGGDIEIGAGLSKMRTGPGFIAVETVRL
jgi:hypothetical protein